MFGGGGAGVAQRTLVVALGGNAIAKAGDDGTIAAQYRRAAEAMQQVAGLLATGARVVLTHGNGPVVGNIVLRGEIARHEVPPTPLYIADADSEGGIGLMLQQVLGNESRKRGLLSLPVTVVTQIVVDPSDEAFSNPTKPIGMHYGRAEAEALGTAHGWRFAEEPGLGWRRLVPSPMPLRVVESDAIVALLDAGMVAIACGGGGVPVTETAGLLRGVDAVIDKDWASALLASTIGADLLVILMEADAVYEGWGTPAETPLAKLTPEHARGLLGEGRLASGSIEPKIRAAVWLAERGIETVICRYEDVEDALSGRAGTRVVTE